MPKAVTSQNMSTDSKKTSLSESNKSQKIRKNSQSTHFDKETTKTSKKISNHRHSQEVHGNLNGSNGNLSEFTDKGFSGKNYSARNKKQGKVKSGNGNNQNVSQRTYCETDSDTVTQMDSAGHFPLSPVFNVRAMNRTNRQTLPSSKFTDEATHFQMLPSQRDEATLDPESPLLLRVSGGHNSQPVLETSPIYVEDFSPSIDYEEESPMILKRSKSLTNDNNINKETPDEDEDALWQRAKKKRDKGKPLSLAIEFSTSYVSPKNLRQTTLSQAFTNSPQKEGKKKKSNSQEEKDLQVALKRSLEDSKDTKGRFMRSKLNLDNTIEDDEWFIDKKKHKTIKGKENSPFKVPQIPFRKVRNRAPSGDGSNTCRTLIDLDHSDIDLDETGSSPKHTKTSSKPDDLPALCKSRLNGSLNPALQLSELCEGTESQSANMLEVITFKYVLNWNSLSNANLTLYGNLLIH